MKNRLKRLEQATRALNGGRCPVCHGRDGQAGTARIWFDGREVPPVFRGTCSTYDAHGRCVRCGAQALDIIIRTPLGGAGLAHEETLGAATA